MGKLPGGELATRPLHFIFICDCSGSMGVDGKIQSLNNAIREAIPHMQKVADENPYADVLIRSLSFAVGAQWHISQPTKVKDLKWTDLIADGDRTDMGYALKMISEQLKVPPMNSKALPPVLVLISDGQPTDNYLAGIDEIKTLPWGKRAIRISIAIGADADKDMLRKFIGNAEIDVLEANNPESLIKHIRWVSTAVLKSASSPASQSPESQQSSINVPIPKANNEGSPDDEVIW